MLKNISKTLAIFVVAIVTLIASNVCVFAADTIAPTTPPNLRITNRSGLLIQLSWGASTDNVAVDHYVLYAEVYNGYATWTEQMAYIPANDTRSRTVGMVTERLYTFYVKAYDAAGNESNASNTFIFNSDATAPSAPANLVCSNKTSTSVTLTWNPSFDNFSGIKKYWIFEVTPEYDNWLGDTTTTSQVISGLSPNTTYTFKVGAIDYGYDGNQSEFTYITVTTNP